jgi:hypothetical protein
VRSRHLHFARLFRDSFDHQRALQAPELESREAVSAVARDHCAMVRDIPSSAKKSASMTIILESMNTAAVQH